MQFAFIENISTSDALAYVTNIIQIENTSCDVPHGTMLGLLLFLIYINDMVKYMYI